jgi:hypothetical protein
MSQGIVPPAAISTPSLSGDQTWTGTETFTGPARFTGGEPHYNARGFASLQAAVTAAAGGGTLFLPPGQYNSGNVQISNASNLVVTGPGATINWLGTAGGGGNLGFQLVGVCTNVTICDLAMNGDGVLANAHAGVWTFSGPTLTNIKVLRNHITNVTVGISLSPDSSGSLTGGLIEGNHIDTVVGTGPGSGYGITHANGSGNPSDLRIVNNLVSRAQRHGIYQAKGSGVVIAGNTVRLHRTGQSIGGSYFCALVCSRSTDCVIDNNIVDTPSDGGLEVSPVVGYASRGVVVSNNVMFGQVNPTPYLLIGSSVPATDGFPEGLTFEGNWFYSNGINGNPVRIQAGKRMQFVNNHIYQLAVTGGEVAPFYIQAIGETAGTAAYTDELMFKNNYIYGTENGGNCYAFEWSSAAASSGLRADFINNRINVPHNTHVFDGPQAASLQLRVLNTPTSGLDLTKLQPTDSIMITPASSATGGAGLRLPPGVAPNTPSDGDVWATASGLFTRINGVTKSVNLT